MKALNHLRTQEFNRDLLLNEHVGPLSFRVGEQMC